MKHKRKKLKAALTVVGKGKGKPVVHERIAQGLLPNSRVAPVQVDDPYEEGAKIIVLRSLRDDPLAHMHAASQIDEAQYMAGRHYQRAREIATIGGVGAIDTTKEAVDGGLMPDPLTDVQRRALRDLALARRELGICGPIVEAVLADGMSIKQYANSIGDGTQRDFDFWGRAFRLALDTLAALFGYSSEKPPQVGRVVAFPWRAGR